MSHPQLKPTKTIDIFESNLQPIGYFVLKARKKLEKWKQGIPDGRSTGFKTLDPYLRLVESEYTLIAARPSMGKTSLAMQIAERVSYQLRDEGDNGVVAIFSAEMAGDELTIRMAAGITGVNIHILRNKPISTYRSRADIEKRENDIRLVEDAFNDIEQNQHMWIDDGSGPTTKTMLDRLSELNEILPIRLMLFDFAELGGDIGQSEELRIGIIHKALKAIAKTLNIPVISLSQLNREVEKRIDKMPQMADLRYSGMAEQIADKVIFIMRPEYYIGRMMTVGDIPDEDRKGVAYIMIAKNRNGPAGAMVKLRYEGDRTRFEDMPL